MQPEHREAAGLWDMHDAMPKIGEYLAGKRYVDFRDDEQLQDAVIRKLTVLGEAAARISPEVRKAYPGIPWQQLVGMPNVVVHQYDKVVLDRIWTTAENDVPNVRWAVAQAAEDFEARLGDDPNDTVESETQ